MQMRFRITVLVLAALAILLAWPFSAEPDEGKAGAGPGNAGKGGEVVDHPKKIKFKPLKFEAPKAPDYRVKLKNGMVVYIAEDHELPIFDIRVMVRTGALYEPGEKTGLAAMCGNLLRKGGTSGMTTEEIDEYMAQLAGSLESEIGFTSGSVSLSVLKEDIDKGLKVMADVLMNPVFDKDEIRRYKEKTLQDIDARYDDPRYLLRDVAGMLAYGKHPAGRITKKSTIEAITRDDLIAFHKKYFFPNNCIVAVAGDFKRGEMIKKLEELLAEWKPGEARFPEVKDVEKKFEKGVYLLESKINQGFVAVGHLGIRESNSDYYAVHIMNAILGGGGFNSRLTDRVRNDEGLAYSVYSYFHMPVEYTGTFVCGLQTKVESVAFALSIVMEEVNRIRTELISEEDLQRAKDQYIEQFPSIFTGRGSSAYVKVKTLSRSEYRRRPLDYYEKYRDNFNKVTREQVREVAKKYLHPDGLKIVVAGNIEKMKKGDGLHKASLEDFGKVKKLEPPKLDE